MATKKIAKKVTVTNKKVVVEPVAKVDFSNSIEKIKGTAKTVNQEVLNTAVEVMEDLRNNGAQLRAVAVAKVKEAINAINETVANINETVTVDNGVQFVKETATNVKETAKKANQVSLATAEDIVDGALKGGKDWQAIATKAIKGGLKLSERQQEITFDALDEVKGQVAGGTERFKGLFKNN